MEPATADSSDIGNVCLSLSDFLPTGARLFPVRLIEAAGRSIKRPQPCALQPLVFFSPADTEMNIKHLLQTFVSAGLLALAVTGGLMWGVGGRRAGRRGAGGARGGAGRGGRGGAGGGA